MNVDAGKIYQINAIYYYGINLTEKEGLAMIALDVES